jgi:hypothetical protein
MASDRLKRKIVLAVDDEAEVRETLEGLLGMCRARKAVGASTREYSWFMFKELRCTRRRIVA